MRDLSLREQMSIHGGKRYKWYGGSNGLVYFGYACYNGYVTVYNWITGESADKD